MLAAVAWDGEGGDLQWTTPANWVGDALPGPGDDVTIDVPEVITVELAGAASVNSLSSQEALILNSGSLTVHAVSVIVAEFTADGNSTLTSSGTTASLTVSGDAALYTTNIFALGGGPILFSGVSSYSGA